MLADFLARLALQSKLKSFVIDPDAPLVKWWMLCQVVVVLYQYVTVWARAAFVAGSAYDIDAWCVVDWVADASLILHMALHMVLGFVDSSNNKMTARADIQRHYVHSAVFAVHLAAAAPVDLLQISLWAGRLSPLCRLNKLLRLLELPALLKLVSSAFRLRIHIRRLSGLVLSVLLVSHTITCVFFILGMRVTSFFPSVFRVAHDTVPLLELPTATLQYLESFYYCLGLMTGLSDGPVPQGLSESAFTIAVMFVGIFTFAIIVGSVSTIIDELSEDESVFQTKLLYVTRVMKQHKLPSELEERVLAYYSYQWKVHQGFDDFKVLQTLPADLRIDVMLELTQSMIEKVPFFVGADSGFVRSLVDRLRPVVVAAGEEVIKAGVIGNEMWFVHRGELDVMVNSTTTDSQRVIVARMQQGNYFGETLLVGKSWNRTVLATTFCDLFSLSRPALEEVLQYYPEMDRTLRRLVALRLEEDRRKERQADLASRYGLKWLQLLYRARERRRSMAARPQPPNVARTASSRHLIRARTHQSLGNIAAGIGKGGSSSEGGLPPSSRFKFAAARTMNDFTQVGLAKEPSQAPRLGLSRILASARGAAASVASTAGLTSSTKATATASEASSMRLPMQRRRSLSSRRGSAEASCGGMQLRRSDTEATATTSSTAASTSRPLLLRGRLQPSTHGLLAWAGIERQTVSRHSWLTGRAKRYGTEWILLPNGGTRVLWAAMLLGAILWNTFLLPARVGFCFDCLLPDQLAIDFLADLIYLGSIPLSRRLAFFDDQGILVKSRRVIRARYRRQRLRRDAIAALPLDLLQPLLYLCGSPIYMLPAVRVVRLLRAKDIPGLASELYSAAATRAPLVGATDYDGKASAKTAHRVRAAPSFSFGRIAQLVFSFVLVAHYIACVAGVAAEFASLDGTSMTFSRYTDGSVIEAPFERFVRAFYFSISNLTGLGRDIKPESVGEHFLTLAVWMLGIFVVAYLVGSVGVLVSNFDAGEARFNKTRNSVVRYMAYQNISFELRTRAFSYFEYLWSRTKGVEIEEVAADLNHSLSTAMLAHICNDAVRAVPLFSDRGPEFIEQIVQVLRFRSFPQGEWLMRKNNIGRAMFFILKGSVDIIVNEKLMFVTATVGVGDFVGEGALLKAQGKCNASARARTSIDTMALTKESFGIILRRFPDIQKSMVEIGGKRRKETQAAIKALDRRLSISVQPLPDAAAAMHADGGGLRQATTAPSRQGLPKDDSDVVASAAAASATAAEAEAAEAAGCTTESISGGDHAPLAGGSPAAEAVRLAAQDGSESQRAEAADDALLPHVAGWLNERGGSSRRLSIASLGDWLRNKSTASSGTEEGRGAPVVKKDEGDRKGRARSGLLLVRAAVRMNRKRRSTEQWRLDTLTRAVERIKSDAQGDEVDP